LPLVSLPPFGRLPHSQEWLCHHFFSTLLRAGAEGSGIDLFTRFRTAGLGNGKRPSSTRVALHSIYNEGQGAMAARFIPPQFSEASLEVLRRRILRRDEAGQPLETPEEMFRRVAWEIAKVERQYEVSEAGIAETAEAFLGMLEALDFLPNSPTLINAGRPGGQLSGCFVLPLEDSMESIFGTLRDMALIQKTGGGTGFSFSRLRPEGDFVASTRGRSSGPVSFMRLYDYACAINRLGGVRSGANMGVMRYDHPDILAFVRAKRDGTSLATFNLSVAASNEFVDAVRRRVNFPLINPRTKRPAGQMNAGELFDAIVKAAWATGDPGLIFLDAINRANPTPLEGAIEATNPCGEQPLLPYESCNLGSINLAHFVRGGAVDKERLARTVRLAVRFLDDVIDANHCPIPDIERVTRGNRKIGLGVMGFADLLVALGLRYDSEEALELGERLAEFIAREARAASAGLAEQRGVFPNFARSIYAAEGKPLRNAAVTTVAPTGTISLIADCSSGIEPLFALCYVREMLGEERAFKIHWLFEQEAGTYLTAPVRERIAETGSVRGVEEIPEKLRRLFVTAHDIAPAAHVRMQAAFQRHTDSAVSKTVNLRREATPDDIRETYLLAHQLGCKGITVFRDGSKPEQVLRAGARRPMPAGAQVCPECGGPMETASGCVTCLVCGYTFCSI
jgi:ribonucleoside-diphosphate reductase alpha chain